MVLGIIRTAGVPHEPLGSDKTTGLDYFPCPY